ncbi:MAG: thiamine phosphate synthase [Syntrophorhabdus sp.]
MRKPTLQDYRLYFVTDPILHKGYSVLEQVELALRGGVKIIQIREKNLPLPEYSKLASEAMKLTRTHNAFLIINDAVDVVKEVAADGLHLGQEDMPITKARAILGNDVIIGISVKTVGEAQQAERDGADYLAVNGVFPTQTKEDLGYCPGLEGVAMIRNNTVLPIVGIGGINLNNCRSVLQAGANGIAVVTSITMSEDIPGTCRSFFKLMSTVDSEKRNVIAIED